MDRKVRLAVHKFASCDGCQLSILDCEDELLALSDYLHFAFFPEASSHFGSGPFDLSLVEGSITTADDLARIKRIREESATLITIGACATAGGIQALRNFAHVDEFTRAVYAHPEYIDTLEHSTAIADHVEVDFELRGCPINKLQLLEVISAFLHKRKPNISSESVCVECKRRGIICVTVARGEVCLGPVTHAGCDALCPAFNRGCFGCYGPKQNPATDSLSEMWQKELGIASTEVLRAYRTYNANAPAFRQESEKHEQ